MMESGQRITDQANKVSIIAHSPQIAGIDRIA
jgi:hypothetical protein